MPQVFPHAERLCLLSSHFHPRRGRPLSRWPRAGRSPRRSRPRLSARAWAPPSPSARSAWTGGGRRPCGRYRLARHLLSPRRVSPHAGGIKTRLLFIACLVDKNSIRPGGHHFHRQPCRPKNKRGRKALRHDSAVYCCTRKRRERA